MSNKAALVAHVTILEYKLKKVKNIAHESVPLTLKMALANISGTITEYFPFLINSSTFRNGTSISKRAENEVIVAEYVPNMNKARNRIKKHKILVELLFPGFVPSITYTLYITLYT